MRLRKCGDRFLGRIPFAKPALMVLLGVTILGAVTGERTFAQGPFYPLIVVGSPDFGASYSNGRLELNFHRSANAAGQPVNIHSTLRPGEGAWVDRPVNAQEPAMIVQSLTEQQAIDVIEWLRRGGIITFYCRNTNKGYFEVSRAEKTKAGMNQAGAGQGPPNKFVVPTRSDRLPSQELIANINGMQRNGTMAMMRRPHLPPICPEGIKLTEDSEGWEEFMYNDSADYCTIGYGHLLKRAPCDGTGPEANYLDGLNQTPDGEKLLQDDLASAHATVLEAVTTKLTDHQIGALTDFVFNVGSGNFRKSTLLTVLNTNDFSQVRTQLMRWVMAGGREWDGLKNRRQAESGLFYRDMQMTEALRRPSRPEQPEKSLPAIDIESGEGPH